MPNLERADACHVCLPCKNHKISHQLVIFRESLRYTCRTSHLGQILVALHLSKLEAALDVAHRFQILVYFAPVRTAKLSAEPFDVLCNGIENAAILLPDR